MAGVEILAMEEVVISYSWSWSTYFLTFVAVTLGMTLLGIFMMGTHAEDVVVSLIVGCIFGAILGALPATFTCPDKYETQYKVTISDEVSMNEFMERYEIIEQEGKIYTVRERNGDAE